MGEIVHNRVGSAVHSLIGAMTLPQLQHSRMLGKRNGIVSEYRSSNRHQIYPSV